MAEGWIKLYRQIWDSELWKERPFDRARAWIDLIMLANFESRNILLGNEIIFVERGSFVTSEHKLMARWGWSKTKVRSFLNLLQNDSMIVKKTDHKKTIVEVLNYCVFQDFETTEEPEKDQRKTSKRPVKDPTNNVKNIKNEKNIVSSNVFADDSLEIILASELFNLILVNNPKAKKPNLQTWAKQFDLIIRIDKRDIDEIRTVINWTQRDSFWMGNILTPKTLRKQFDKLTIQMQKQKPNGQAKPEQKTSPDKYENFYL